MISISCKTITICLIVVLTVGHVRADDAAPPPDYLYPIGTCTATATITPRLTGAWTENNTYFQPYDISLQNTGTCIIGVAQLFFPDDEHVTQTWNFQIGGMFGLANVVTFAQGFVFGPGAVFTGAGFVLPQPFTAEGATVRGNCNCVPEEEDPTVAPTSAPSSGPITTPPTGCGSAINIETVIDSRWQVEGTQHQIVDLLILNNGTLAISSLQINIVTDGVISSDVWNLELVSDNTYEVLLYGSPLNPQARLNNPGFELIGANTISCEVAQVAC